MTAETKRTVWRVLLALLTAAVLVVGFYFPLIGLGYAMDASLAPKERVVGLLLFLPAVGLLVLLVAMLPTICGRALLWLGVGGSLLITPSLAACASTLRLNWIVGAIPGLLYLWAWWHLARPRLTRGTLVAV